MGGVDQRVWGFSGVLRGEALALRSRELKKYNEINRRLRKRVGSFAHTGYQIVYGLRYGNESNGLPSSTSRPTRAKVS